MLVGCKRSARRRFLFSDNGAPGGRQHADCGAKPGGRAPLGRTTAVRIDAEQFRLIPAPKIVPIFTINVQVLGFLRSVRFRGEGGGTRCGAARAAMDGAIDSALRTKRHPAPRGSPRFVSSAAARGTATTHFFISRGSRGRNRGRSRRAQTLWFYKVGRGTPVGHELGDRDSFKTKKGESPSGKTRGRFTQNVCTAAAAAAALRWQRSKNKQGRCPQKRRHCGQKNETCTLSKVLPRGTAHSVSRSGGRRRPKAIWRDMQWLRGTDWDCECKSGCNALHGAPSAKGDTQKKEDRV